MAGFISSVVQDKLFLCGFGYDSLEAMYNEKVTYFKAAFKMAKGVFTDPLLLVLVFYTMAIAASRTLNWSSGWRATA